MVAADSRSPRDSRVLEILGTYYPLLEPSGVEINNSRAVHWMSKGAQPSEAVAKLLKISGAAAEFEAHKAGRTTTPAAATPPAAAAPAATSETSAS